jgi:Cyclin, N-terminal domain
MLQLHGCACLLVAAMFEEEHPPVVNALVYIGDKMCIHRMVLRMELPAVLKQLRFYSTAIIPHHAMQRSATAAACVGTRSQRPAALAVVRACAALRHTKSLVMSPSHRSFALDDNSL